MVAESGSKLRQALAHLDANEPDEFEAVADRFITSLRVVAHDPAWSLGDSVKRPEVTYAIVLSDAGWAAHLREGLSWDSVAWVEDESAPMLAMADPI